VGQCLSFFLEKKKEAKKNHLGDWIFHLTVERTLLYPMPLLTFASLRLPAKENKRLKSIHQKRFFCFFFFRLKKEGLLRSFPLNRELTLTTNPKGVIPHARLG